MCEKKAFTFLSRSCTNSRDVRMDIDINFGHGTMARTYLLVTVKDEDGVSIYFARACGQSTRFRRTLGSNFGDVDFAQLCYSKVRRKMICTVLTVN